MQITLITDCRDDNAKIRQIIKWQSLFSDAQINFLGVKDDIEASGNLIDILDVQEEGVVFVNVSPRNGQAKKFKNGSPFIWFQYKKALIVSSAQGKALSLLKKLDQLPNFFYLNLPSSKTQFRSLNVLPKFIKKFIHNHTEKVTPDKPLDPKELPSVDYPYWQIDCFGNIKTTFLNEQEARQKWEVLQDLPLYPRLKDVPDDKLALVTGSSGLEDKRFIEVVKQGGTAWESLNKTL